MSLHPTEALPALDWTSWDTRYLFFTGKGGVGKTTTASAVAVALADAGKRTLVISTDPASNLDDVFGIHAGPQPTAIPGVPGLFVSNLDPEAAAEAFKERAVGPYRGVLPQSAIASMEEQLSGACTVEIAAFNEFTAVLAAPQNTGRVSPRHLRHRTDRTHPTAADAPERVERLRRRAPGRSQLPRPARGP